MISRLLVANRGEIARRVFRTCRDLGVQTVAVFSDADADAPYIREADAAVRLPGTAAADTYLRGELLVEAAITAGADAVHPGYGFLSESAGFARQVTEAGLTWVGPPAAAIEMMGSKVAAKRLMTDAGVPVLGELDPDTVTAEQLPVLVKASAGGGGRGMRVVRDLGSLTDEVRAASAEAASAFGDPAVFCEPYVEHGRHVEMQVLADAHGNVWVLGERDCSVQRRHQKVVEETPSPAVDPALRAKLTAAAEAATKAVGYVGAGTVEFLLAGGSGGRPGVSGGRARGGAPRRGFYFLEMNTRLQVEHPVTECVYGLDLVERQIAIAEGAVLAEAPPQLDGHAVEARLYAEDPGADWLAQSGAVHRFSVPGVDATFAAPPSYGLRLDSGVESGSVVSPHYDAMLAKLVAWAPDRASAMRRLEAALALAQVHGITTNRALLVGILRDADFRARGATTAFLNAETVRKFALSPEETGPEGAGPEGEGGERETRVCALAAAVADARRRSTGVAPPAWRNVVSQPQQKRYRAGEQEVAVCYRWERGRLLPCDLPGVDVVAATPQTVTLRVDGVHRRFEVASYTDGTVSVDSARTHADLRRLPRFVDPEDRVEAGSLLAPMPASVVAVAVADGERVEAGQPIVVLEAMKMQHTIRAHLSGTVSALSVATGHRVDAGRVLAVLTPEGEPS